MGNCRALDRTGAVSGQAPRGVAGTPRPGVPTLRSRRAYQRSETWFRLTLRRDVSSGSCGWLNLFDPNAWMRRRFPFAECPRLEIRLNLSRSVLRRIDGSRDVQNCTTAAPPFPFPPVLLPGGRFHHPWLPRAWLDLLSHSRFCSDRWIRTAAISARSGAREREHDWDDRIDRAGRVGWPTISATGIIILICGPAVVRDFLAFICLATGVAY